MGDKSLILGESGSGKSTSIRNLNPEETAIVRVVKKPLPFKGWKKMYVPYNKETKEGNLFDIGKWETLCNLMEFIDTSMPHIKVLIIDDAQYIMSLELFDRAKEKGYDKFTELADHMKKVIMKPDNLRDDLHVVMLAHTEDVSSNGYTKTKMKTIGKMLDAALTIEGLFTVVLKAQPLVKGKDEMEFVFSTQTDGTDTVKSPMGMFGSKYIPNDLNYVLERIKEYNEG